MLVVAGAAMVVVAATHGVISPRATAGVVVLAAVFVGVRRPTSGRWEAGAAAERWTAAALEQAERRQGFTVLHDLWVPGRHSNLDHVVVGSAGVVVVETKHWRGSVRVTPFGLRRDGERERRAIEQVREQLASVRDVVGCRVPVTGFLCIHGAGVRTAWWWPRRVVAGVRVGSAAELTPWLRRLPRRLRRQEVEPVVALLRRTFVPTG